VLAQSEEQLGLAILASDIGLWDLDIETGALTVNDRWAAMLGYTVEELAPTTRETWGGMLQPDDLEEAERQIKLNFSGELPFYMCEVRMRHKDGHWVWVSTRGQVTERDAAGRPHRMTGTHIDISERKRTELALRQSRDQLEQMVHDVAESMGRVVEARDPYTQGHQQRVAMFARQLAEHLGLDEDTVNGIEMAGLLHDVGKLHVPSEILTKPGRLSEAEFALIREHPRQGHDILKDIAFPWDIAQMVLEHHERMDGSGYPGGLLGEEIPMSARILAVADVVEAMASHRPYRPALGLDAAIAEVRDHPAMYDRDAVAACIELHEAGLITL
jgi:PAS domain S-box-containing protein/putative nucleotidyltransferase with HDIG domain